MNLERGGFNFLCFTLNFDPAFLFDCVIFFVIMNLTCSIKILAGVDLTFIYRAEPGEPPPPLARKVCGVPGKGFVPCLKSCIVTIAKEWKTHRCW